MKIQVYVPLFRSQYKLSKLKWLFPFQEGWNKKPMYRLFASLLALVNQLVSLIASKGVKWILWLIILNDATNPICMGSVTHIYLINSSDIVMVCQTPHTSNPPIHELKYINLQVIWTSLHYLYYKWQGSIVLNSMGMDFRFFWRRCAQDFKTKGSRMMFDSGLLSKFTWEVG